VKSYDVAEFPEVNMTKLMVNGLLIFFILLISVALMSSQFQLEFGEVNFFAKRTVFFLFFVTLFPRLTLLFSSVAFGGLFWWLGFFFCPRILVATLATVAYFHTNPLLVVISWMIALGGEVFEKWSVGNRRVFVNIGGRGFSYNKTGPSSKTKKRIDENTIEAEFKRMD